MNTEEIKKEEIKNNNESKKDLILGGAIGLGIMALGYKLGCRATSKAISSGIDACWKEDPTLKDHMWDVVTKVLKKKD